MKMTEIEDMWAVDSVIDESRLDRASLNIPLLHAKYYKLYAQEKCSLARRQYLYNELYRKKIEYYMGILPKEELKEHGWTPFPMKILRSDMTIYTNSDKDLNEEDAKIEVQRIKVEFLKSILDSIAKQGFVIKNAIDYQRFQAGSI